MAWKDPYVCFHGVDAVKGRALWEAWPVLFLLAGLPQHFEELGGIDGRYTTTVLVLLQLCL